MRRRANQRGITLVVIAVAMFSLIAIAGLALDIGNLVVNKARFQATVDSAALSAAKILDTTASTTAATAAARNVIATNAAYQPQLQAVFGGVRQRIDYSNTLQPFNSGSTPPLYVRVRASNFSIAATFARVMGFRIFNLDASAVAGPSPTLGNACNLTSMMVCGTAPTGAAPVYGYSVGQITALQLSSGSSRATFAPGYYLQMSSGGNSVSQNFAGGFVGCSAVGNNIASQSSSLPTPTAQGLNARFNEYDSGDVNNAADPPDVITTQPIGAARLSCTDPTCATVTTGAGVINNASQYGAYSYEGMYQPRLQTGTYDNPPAPGGNGVVDRRVLAVPVGDCTGAAPGTSNVPVLGLACMFMLQDVDETANGGQVFAEVLPSCEVNGTPGPVPNNAPGPYSIQLYHVLGSEQS
jgi:hypothetical protein